MNRLRPRIVSRYPQAANAEPPHTRIAARTRASDTDLTRLGLRDYFASAGYASRVAMEDAALTERLAAEMACRGLPIELLERLRRLAVIAMQSGSGAARQALNADLSIEVRDHFAIEGILKSISTRL